jgi:hypothetical protein
MINLAKDISFLVATPNVAENHPIGAGFRPYRKIDVAMELTARRL